MAVQPVPHRFTVGEYHLMAESGVFGEDDRVELLEGEIIETAPIGSQHAACVTRLNRELQDRRGDSAIVAVPNPVRLGEHSEAQPGVALLRPRSDDYSSRHPGPHDVLLLVEVGDAAWDTQRKLPVYAAAGVEEVWLVDLNAPAIEICRWPRAASTASAASCSWWARPGSASHRCRRRRPRFAKAAGMTVLRGPAVQRTAPLPDRPSAAPVQPICSTLRPWSPPPRPSDAP